MASAGMTSGGRRWSLDELVARVRQPGFVARYFRAPRLIEAGGHVSPSILAVQSPRSGYVGRWRRHARRCPACAGVFRYFGFSL